jgi:hypothetical protein
MTTESSPILTHAGSDRTYDVLSPIETLAGLFRALGFVYEGKGAPGGLWLHRWHHNGPSGRTMLVLFKPYGNKPPRLALIGPRIESVEQLCGATIEEDDAGGRWVDFSGVPRC